MPDNEIPGMYGLCWSDLPLSDEEIEDLEMSDVFHPDAPTWPWKTPEGASRDHNSTMIPMSGNALRRECGLCGCEIEPFEPYHRGKTSGVLWCDTCYVEDVVSD